MPEEEPKLPTLPHDLLDPETFLPGTPWWHHALIVLAVLLALAALVWFMWKKLNQASPPALPARDYLKKAKNALSKINKDLPTGEISAQCSLILREALHKIYREPVLFETDEEIKLRANSLEKVPEPQRGETIKFLEKLGEEKYAPSQVNESRAEQWIKQSEETLEALGRSQEEKATDITSGYKKDGI